MSDGIDAGFPLDEKFRGAVVPDPDARVPAREQRPVSFTQS